MDEMPWLTTTNVGIVLLLVGLAGLAFWLATRPLRAQNRGLLQVQRQHTSRLDAFDRQLAAVGQAVLPISTAFQTILVKELTHFHTPRMDELLVKLGPPYTLTQAEEDELIAALEERERDMGDEISAAERDAAHIFPMIMRRAKVEADALASGPQAFNLLTVLAPLHADADAHGPK